MSDEPETTPDRRDALDGVYPGDWPDDGSDDVEAEPTDSFAVLEDATAAQTVASTFGTDPEDIGESPGAATPGAIPDARDPLREHEDEGGFGDVRVGVTETDEDRLMGDRYSEDLVFRETSPAPHELDDQEVEDALRDPDVEPLE